MINRLLMNGETLLLVDDDPEITGSLGGRLGEEGYRVLTASTGEAALDIMAREPVDLLCTEIIMPGKGGLDLIRESSALYPGLLSMVMTGHGDMESVIEAMRLGASNFCRKPVTYPFLKNAVDRCLSKLRLERELAAYQSGLEELVELRTEALRKEVRGRRAAEKRYREIVEDTGDMIVQMDLGGTLHFANSRALERLGIDPEELGEVSFLSFVHPGERDGVRSWLSGAAERGTPWENTETRLRAADGTVVHTAWRWNFRYGEAAFSETVSGIGTDVTEVRRADRKLRENELRLRRMAEATFEGITFSVDGRLIDSNDQFANLVGYSREEVIGMEAGDLVSPGFREKVAGHIRREYPRAYESELLRRDGSRIPVEVRGKMISLGKKKVRVTALRDMTQRKRDGERLKRSEEKFRAIADYTYDWETWTDPEGRILWTNPAVERMLGYAPDVYLAMTDRWRKAIHPDDYGWVVPLFRKILKERKRENDLELRLVRKDGSILWASLSCQPIYNGEGKYLGIRNSIRDISERKRMEKRMGENHMRHREAQRIARLGHWELHIPSGALTWSDEVFRIFEMTRGPLSYDDFLSVIHPADRKAVTEAYEKSLAEGTEYGIVHRLLFEDGRVKHVREKCRTDYDENGLPLRSVGTVQDITKTHLLEIETRARRERLARADKLITLGTLVSWVGRGINTPNNRIMANLPTLEAVYKDSLEALERRYETSGEFYMGKMPYSRVRTKIRRLPAGIREGVERIRRIALDLKTYAAPSPVSSMGEIAMEDVLKGALLLMEGGIQSRTDHFSVSIRGDLPRVRGDRLRLEQVVVNLLQNACNALEDRSRAVAVELLHDRENVRVTLLVRDEGAGIPEENLGRIREAFFTTGRETGGTGLGLAICDRIIGDHGGTLEFQRGLKRGTVVAVHLPAKGPPAVAVNRRRK